MTSFYMDYVINHKNVRQLMLPPLFPLVLYNGEVSWTAPVNIAELIEAYPPLGKHSLNFEHFVIAENRYGKDALRSIRNIVSTLFLAEVHYDLPMLADQLLMLYDSEEDKQALSLFLNWFQQLAAHGYMPASDYTEIEQEYRTKEEVQSMLVKALARERETLWQQGLEIGEARGKEERDRQIVRTMVEKGFALALIAEVTQLTPAEIQRLLTEAPPAPPRLDLLGRKQ